MRPAQQKRKSRDTESGRRIGKQREPSQFSLENQGIEREREREWEGERRKG